MVDKATCYGCELWPVAWEGNQNDKISKTVQEYETTKGDKK
jgi:hypothetical protein